MRGSLVAARPVARVMKKSSGVIILAVSLTASGPGGFQVLTRSR